MRAIQLSIAALLGIAAFIVGQKVIAATASEPSHAEAPAAVSQDIVISEELTSKWIENLGTGEWLHFSSTFELAQSDLGNDPETGLPLPNIALWEIWLKLDADGRQTASLTRRTDLERGQVSYVAWEGGVLVRLPSGARESTQGRDIWETFYPIRDHYCNSRLNQLPSSEGVEVVVETSQDDNDWSVTITTFHPPVHDVSGFEGVFIGSRFVCHRNQTGAVSSAKEYLITQAGEYVLAWRETDQSATWVDELPEDIEELHRYLLAAEDN